MKDGIQKTAPRNIHMINSFRTAESKQRRVCNGYMGKTFLLPLDPGGRHLCYDSNPQHLLAAENIS